MIASRIKYLREQCHMTQAVLAKQLGVTRSSVNAWEMGVSVPSVHCVVALAEIFGISTDFILGMDFTPSVSVEGLSEKNVQLVYSIVKHLQDSPWDE